ncbi:MAG: serine/threonine-protein kinase [Aquimonas sp.]|nr:serine/threonine-protein kinase [Aquimonas sp.]
MQPNVSEPGFPGLGDLLGPWRLDARLQAGGMGVVFSASRADGSYAQRVAIKLVRPTYLQADPALAALMTRRFEQERQLLARLSHPNIARIVDGGWTPSGLPWLAMEFVEGRDLLAHARSAGLDVRARVHLLAQVCDAVAEAHRHLVVHRDLKPDNVLVGADGSPRLLDFGIALLLDGAGQGSVPESTLTAYTPAYASPEQLLQQLVTTRSDVYSLGVLLYELLTDTRPFEPAGLSPEELCRQVVHLPPPTLAEGIGRAQLQPSERRRRLREASHELDSILRRALAKQPSDRYDSAQAMAADLRRWLQHRPLAAHPGGIGYRLRCLLRRQRVASVLLAVAGIGIAAALALALQQGLAARDAASDLAEVNGFLAEVLARSDPYDSGRSLSLAEAVDQAAAEVQPRFGASPRLAAPIRLALGYSQLSRGMLESAERLLAQGLGDSEVLPAFDPVRLQLREAWAQLHIARGELDEGRAQLQALAAELDGADSEGARRTRYLVLNNLAVIDLRQGRYGVARERLLEAQALGAPAGRVAEATLVSNLAQAAHGLEAPEQAGALYAQAEALLRAEFPQGHPDLTTVLGNRAELLVEAGQAGQALVLIDEALAMRVSALGASHASLGLPMMNRAMILLALERSTEALAALEQVVELAVELNPQLARERITALLLQVRLLRENEPARAMDLLVQAEALLVVAPPEVREAMAEPTAVVRERLCELAADALGGRCWSRPAASD